MFESEKETYDLIVVGADDDQIAQLAWIKRQTCYVLVIYGKEKARRPTLTTNDEMEMELPRLSVSIE